LGGNGRPWRTGAEVYGDPDFLPCEIISRKLSVPNAERIYFLRHAPRADFTIEDVLSQTKIDQWCWFKEKKSSSSKRTRHQQELT
jgi:hypothetical protein